MIWGVQNGLQPKAFAFSLASDTAIASKNIAEGDWVFYAAGWSGSTPLSGNIRCAKVPTIIAGSTQTVKITLSPAACDDPEIFFGDSTFLSPQTIGSSTNSVPSPLRIVSCNDISGQSGLGNCAGSLLGDFHFYRIVLPDFDSNDAFNPAAPPEAPRGLESECLATDSTSVLDTGLKIPVGRPGHSTIFFLLQAFTGSGCDDSSRFEYRFIRGLRNSPGIGVAAVFSQSAKTVAYLQHGPAIAVSAPTGISLLTPASSPGPSATPVIHVVGVASGDNVKLFDGPSCTSAVLGSGTSAGTSINITSNTLADGSLTHFYANRTNGSGTSPCSPVGVDYVTDITSPAVSLASTTGSAFNSGVTHTVNFNFSEAPGASFTQVDISVTNGTSGSFTQIDATHYSAVITPTADGAVTVSVAASTFNDAAGNVNSASNVLTRTYDTTVPTVSLSSGAPSLFNTAPLPVTFTFSEPVVGFTNADISVSNGTAGNFTQVDGTHYTADITPSANGAVGVSVPAAAFTDPATNANAASSTLTRTFDNVAPTVANVTSTFSNATYNTGDTIQISVVFSENVNVTGTPTLSLNSGGTASYLSGSGTSTLVFTNTVASSDTTSGGRLDYSNTSSLSLSGGTIKDAALNNATLALPTPGFGNAGSLANNKNIIVSSLPIISVAAAYGGFPSWNDYIVFSNSGQPDYAQTSVSTCTGSETGYLGAPSGCIHAGEKRKVVVTGKSSCSGLSITDALGAWDWTCDASSGTATFYSKRLKPGKNLRDIVSATAFLNNSVTVTFNADSSSSPSTTWGWSNTFAALNTGQSTVQSLATAGNIYTMSANSNTRGFTISADRIAVVTLGTTTLTYDAVVADNYSATGCTTATPAKSQILCAQGVNFLWIEATLNGGSGANKSKRGILFESVKDSRINSTSIKGVNPAANPEGAIAFSNSSLNFVTGTLAQGVGVLGGLDLVSSTFNQFYNVKFGDNQIGGDPASLVSITSSSNSNRFYRMTLGNIVNSSGTTAVAGVILNGGNSNSFNQVIVSNISIGGGTTASGFDIRNGSSGTILNNVSVNNTNDSGIFLNGGDNSIIDHVTTINSNFQGIAINGAETQGNYIHSALAINAGTGIGTDVAYTNTGAANLISDVAVAKGAPNVMDFSQPVGGGSGTITITGSIVRPSGQACAGGNVLTQTLSGTCTITGATTVTSAVGSTILGKVTGADSANGSTVTIGTKAFSSITDFLNFDNSYRGWGIDGGTLPISTNWGACLSGTCRLWDMRVATGGAVQNFNGTFTAGSACPAAVAGSVTATVNSITFLPNASEIIEDGIGNDNGLCESNEACTFSPNIGAYQGEGALGSTCTFSGGTITGVSMYGFPTTGI